MNGYHSVHSAPDSRVNRIDLGVKAKSKVKVNPLHLFDSDREGDSDILNLGCILLGLFWLFLFRFRNIRIQGISISKRTLIYSENGILMAEVT